MAFAGAFEHVEFAALYKGDDAAETRGALGEGNAFEFAQEFLHVACRVLRLTCIAGRVDSRGAVEYVDFKACVVGKAVLAEHFPHKLCFLYGVFPDGEVGFGHVICITQVRRKLQGEALAEHPGSFDELVAVGGREDQCLSGISHCVFLIAQR